MALGSLVRRVRSVATRRPRVVLLASLAITLTLTALVACTAGFDPKSKVDSVRLFVVRADKPYAKEGETVTLEALFADARREQPRPARLYWIPIVCVNPPEDLYYLCFAPPGDGGRQAGDTRLVPVGELAERLDGGADAGGNGATGGVGGALASLPTGVDLAPFLPSGPTFSFTAPPAIIKAREGAPPYGLMIIFNILCAGRVEIAAELDMNAAQQLPLRCLGDDGAPLSPNDFVVGISRVYSYADRTNENPVIEGVTFEGNEVSLTDGITVDRCPQETKQSECPAVKIDMRVSEASWEENPSDVLDQGPLREQIWVSYYSDIGVLGSDARLLFDAREGRIATSPVELRAPKGPGSGTLWAVVHDNRGGAAWSVVPLHVR